MSGKSDQAAALQKAIEIIGGLTATGRGVGVSPQAVKQWPICPPTRVLQVERLTDGRVSRHDLRPDLYPAEAEFRAGVSP